MPKSESRSEVLFKYSELKKFLSYIQERYTVTPVGEWDGSNAIILRHDVDIDIKAAYDLALVEKECNIKSTFFIMTTNYTYNPASQNSRKMLVEMSKWGFEIGLHFDPCIYPEKNIKELKNRVDYEANVLSNIVGKKIKSVSLHNPSLNGGYPLFEGYNNAYDKRIFSPDRYISDSRMIFREDIYKFVESATRHPIQILLHPIHYTKDGKTTYPDLLQRFVANFANEIDTKLRRNSTYAEQIGGDTLFSYMIKKNSEKRE